MWRFSERGLAGTLLPAAEPEAPVRLADILDDGGEHSPAALRRELAAYGAGPPSALAGPDRTHWCVMAAAVRPPPTAQYFVVSCFFFFFICVLRV